MNENLTLSKFLDRWLELHVRESCRPKTFVNYAETCDRYLKPQLGQVRLERLTPAHVQKLLRSLEQQGKTHPPVLRHTGFCRALSTWPCAGNCSPVIRQLLFAPHAW